MPYLKAEFVVSAGRAEAALAALACLGMLGSEETAEASRLRMCACFSDGTEPGRVESALRAAGVTGPVSLARIEEQDWNAAWRESIQPVELVPGTWVSPSWRPPPMASGQRWIRIEPRMAFGTGHHESTRLAARAMGAAVATLGGRPRLLDVGAGSGVLCFHGALLGCVSCLGVEIDTPCRTSMAANLRDNRCRTVQLVIGEVACVRPGARFDCVVMNMIYPDAAPLLAGLARRLAPGGLLVWSGILAEGRQEACAAAAHAGLFLTGEFTENEWWAGMFGGMEQQEKTE